MTVITVDEKMDSLECCTWLIKKSDEKLALMQVVRSKSRSEGYHFMVRMVKKRALTALLSMGITF